MTRDTEKSADAWYYRGGVRHACPSVRSRIALKTLASFGELALVASYYAFFVYCLTSGISGSLLAAVAGFGVMVTVGVLADPPMLALSWLVDTTP